MMRFHPLPLLWLSDSPCMWRNLYDHLFCNAIIIIRSIFFFGAFFAFFSYLWVVSECVPLQSIMHRGDEKKNANGNIVPYVSAELWHFAFHMYVPSVVVYVYVYRSETVKDSLPNSMRLFVVPLLCHHYECFSIQKCVCVRHLFAIIWSVASSYLSRVSALLVYGCKEAGNLFKTIKATI